MVARFFKRRAVSRTSSYSRGLSSVIRAPAAMAVSMMAASFDDPLTEIRLGGTPVVSAACSSLGPKQSQPVPSALRMRRSASTKFALIDGRTCTGPPHACSRTDRIRRTFRLSWSAEMTYSGVPKRLATSSVSHPSIQRCPPRTESASSRTSRLATRDWSATRRYNTPRRAGVAQLVERLPSK